MIFIGSFACSRATRNRSLERGLRFTEFFFFFFKASAQCTKPAQPPQVAAAAAHYKLTEIGLKGVSLDARCTKIFQEWSEQKKETNALLKVRARGGLFNSRYTEQPARPNNQRARNQTMLVL